MKSLQKLVKEANEEFGDNSIIIPELGGSMINESPEALETGYKPLDDALGIGGLPRGRIVEILGEEASGKTTLVLHVIKSAQAKGLRCAFIDTEHALERQRAQDIGVDFDKLAISQPDTGEQALDLLDFLVRSGEFGVVVLDSVAAIVPKAEIEGEVSDANMGLVARMMGKTMRKITAPANRTKTLVIFTNQLRAQMGGFSPFPTKIGTGGNALKFYASVRLDMRRTGNNKTVKSTSTNHKITIKKNKLAPAHEIVLAKIGKNGFI